MTPHRLAVALTAALLGVLLATEVRSEGASTARTESIALFHQVNSVLQSRRCMNCHTGTGFPRQGEDGHRHLFNIVAGADGLGAPGMHCFTCHQATNTAASGVPGAANWRLPPLSMAWEGLSEGQLCRTILDPAKNGGRTPVQLLEHMTYDRDVAWAWTPGTDHRGQARLPPPLSHEEFRKVLGRWIETGAACPD